MTQFGSALFNSGGGDVCDGCRWLVILFSSVMMQEIIVL